MRRLVLSLTALGSAGLMGAAPAIAGSCGMGAPMPQCNIKPVVQCAPGMSMDQCRTPVRVMPAPQYVVDPVTVHTANPMGHLRTIQFKGAPNVSITRVYGQGQTVGLSDFPSKFTGGCHPTSTQYCRQAAPQAAPVAMPSIRPAPPAVTHTPRVYGSLETVPGIAHVPTSIVDRSWDNAMAALNSGRTQPQPVVSGGMVPRPTNVVSAPVAQPLSYVAPPRVAPMPAPRPIGTVTHTMQTGEHWEKVSGPTQFGNTMATQVICKRGGQSVNVERQVIGVPTPMPIGCASPMGAAPMAGPAMSGGHILAGGPVSRRYGS